MLWVLLAGIGVLINGDQPPEAHQTAPPVAAILMVLPFHMPSHLARAVEPGHRPKNLAPQQAVRSSNAAYRSLPY